MAVWATALPSPPNTEINGRAAAYIQFGVEKKKSHRKKKIIFFLRESTFFCVRRAAESAARARIVQRLICKHSSRKIGVSGSCAIESKDAWRALLTTRQEKMTKKKCDKRTFVTVSNGARQRGKKETRRQNMKIKTTAIDAARKQPSTTHPLHGDAVVLFFLSTLTRLMAATDDESFQRELDAELRTPLAKNCCCSSASTD
jgi:hypothetical protein